MGSEGSSRLLVLGTGGVVGLGDEGGVSFLINSAY